MHRRLGRIAVVALGIFSQAAFAQTPVVPSVPRQPTRVDPSEADAATPGEQIPQQPATPAVLKTIDVPPAKIAPQTPGLPPTPAAAEPQPAKITVQETMPVGAPVPPPNSRPDLSSPAPPPETLVYPPTERYYLMIFGYETVPKRARRTHTWMTMAKATPKPGADHAYDVTAHTISWMPRSLDVRIARLRPECGVNLNLQQSLDLACSHGGCIALWGPYEVTPTVAAELYDKTLKQIARLNSGRVLYKAVDPDHFPQASYVCDCIHAVTDLDGVGRRGMLYDERRAFGIAASHNLARIMYASQRLDTSTTHDWLLEALELDKHRIERRHLPKPPPIAPPQTAQEAADAAAKP